MLPFILLVGLAVYAGSRFAHAHDSAKAGSELALPAPKTPSPIGVLVEMARQGIQPPPKVIMCALAECQLLGRQDLALDIVRLFVAPVVYAASLRNANPASSPYADGGGGMQAQMIQAPMPPMQPPPMMLPPPPMAMAPQMMAQQASPTGQPLAMDYAVAAAQRARQAMAQRNEWQSAPSALEPLPVPVPTQPPLQAQQIPIQQPANAAAAAPAAPTAPRQPTDQELINEMLRQAGVPVPDAAPPSPDESAVVTAGEVAIDHSRARRASVPPPSWFMSPLPSVSDMAWTQFASTLQRQDAMFDGPRHVGQFRARRSRLEELGIDPSEIVGSAQAQYRALEQDMRDAYHHVMQNDELAAQMHRMIRVPGSPDPHIVSLSGILGVMQCAGLEAAVSWFENARDRERFPHTTMQFIRTNGAF